MYKDCYNESKKAIYLNVPKFIYLTCDGTGGPEGEDFQKIIPLLYKFSYKLRMSQKGDLRVPNFENYVVGPLEGIWSTNDNKEFNINKKESLIFKLMINQPPFFTKEIFDICKEELIKTNPDFERIKYEEITEGESIQILHVGSFDDEPITLKNLHDKLKEDGKEYIPSSHHEIYLSDWRKTAPEKLKTIIRYKIK